MQKRNEIEEKYKWDLSSYFKSDDQWQNELEKVKPMYDRLETFEGKLDNREDILNCLVLDKEISEIVGRLYVYISLKVKEDGKNNFYQNLSNKLEKFLSEKSPRVAFITSELNGLSDDFLTSLSNDKAFFDFDLYLKHIIRNKAHMLPKNEEKLLAAMGECVGGAGDIFDMIDAVDIKFDDVTDNDGKKYPLNNANYYTYLQSGDKKLRETAFKNLNGGYGKLNYTLGAIYLNNIKTDFTLAKVKKFQSSFEQSLFYEEVDSSVYQTLIDEVSRNRNSFYRYYENKRKALGLDVFNNYDINAKLNCKNNHVYTYDEAFDIVINALSVLGEDYTNVLKTAKEKRWIDVMPNENKDTGAFSWGAYGANPVVMLNFDGTINSVFTLAHELGHMMHTFYSNKNLPSTKAGYEIFVAEVASTVNEMILAKYLLKNAVATDERLFYMEYILNMFQSTVNRQTMFAEFEKIAHAEYENGGDVTTQALNNIYIMLCKKYFGDKVNLVDELKYEWSRIPHFYTSFYVYKYATGLISALCISNKVLSSDKSAIDNYKKFLQSGATKPPVELLCIAGADLSDNNTFKFAFEFIDKTLDEWDKICK